MHERYKKLLKSDKFIKKIIRHVLNVIKTSAKWVVHRKLECDKVVTITNIFYPSTSRSFRKPLI